LPYPGAASICASCQSPCSTCYGTSTNCTSCQIGMTVVNNSCVCAPGYYNASINSTFQCMPCHPLSLTCFGPNFWESYMCMSNIQNIASISGTTCQCKPGYFYANYSCFPCGGKCQTCNSTATHCTKCINGISLMLKDNMCVCNLGMGFYETSNNNTTVCNSCHPLAQTCSGPQFWQALTCNNTIQNIAPIINNTTCQCLDGFYFIPSNVFLPGFAICGSI
jgi:hypothetical protein